MRGGTRTRTSWRGRGGKSYPTLAAAREAARKAAREALADFTPSHGGRKGGYSVSPPRTETTQPSLVGTETGDAGDAGDAVEGQLDQAVDVLDALLDSRNHRSPSPSVSLHLDHGTNEDDNASLSPSASIPSPSSMASTLVSRIPVEIVGKDRLYPGNDVSSFMTKLFKEKLCPEGYTWASVTKDTLDWYWMLFKKSFSFQPDNERNVYSVWLRHAGYRYSELMSHLRKRKKQPRYVQKSIWEAYWKEWNKTEFKEVCRKRSANRQNEVNGPGSGMSVHNGGSKSAVIYALELTKKLGRKPTRYEVYKKLHWNEAKGKWADSRSEKVVLEMESLISNDPSLTADSNIEGEQSNKRIDELYITVVGGTCKKRRLYGLGSYGTSQFSHCSETELERVREEGRVEGRAEVQVKLDELQQQFKTFEERFEMMMSQSGGETRLNVN